MSRVVFVGNVPYDMTEEQLTQVFSSVGPVAGFRLVFDRETGKAKGYGFCEFFDHESAASAVRNLHGTDVGGRSLRIDLADADPALEGKFTSRGEILGERDSHRGPPPHNLILHTEWCSNPAWLKFFGCITNAIVALGPEKQIELLQQVKSFVTSNSEAARAVLVAHPQLAYACFQTMLMTNVVDPAVLQKMLPGGGAQPPAAQAPIQTPAPVPPPSAPPVPPPMNQYPPNYYAPPPPVNPAYAQYQAPPPVPAPAPVAPPPVPALPGVSAQQQAMIQQVLSLTPDQINGLPANERAAIMQLRSQFGVV
ncbi:RNA recognition motif protein [Ceratobasidium sp. AG-Ba]|nr:RNA recognition motif protein [Ceratobasidium sp. AG-Ba]